MEPTKKTSDPQKYIREYMRARYAANKERGATISKINYYKRQGCLTKEETKQYGDLSPYIAKTKKALDSLKEQNPAILEDFIFNYLEQLSIPNV